MKAIFLFALGLTLAAAATQVPVVHGSMASWSVLIGLQVPSAAWVVWRWKNQGILSEMMAPKWGDISLATLSAVALLAIVVFVRFVLLPAGPVYLGWIDAVYDTFGPFRAVQDRWWLVLLAVVALAFVEEVVWRGEVLEWMEGRWGTRRGWILAGVAYALCFLPLAWLLRTEAGMNPLVVGVALLGGLAWSYLAVRTRRLIPSVLSHAVLLWFLIVQFRWFGAPPG